VNRSSGRQPPAEAGRRRRLPVGERRAQFVAVGLELFRDRSVYEVSVAEVAHAVGVSVGLVYHHFGSKRGFHVAVVAAAYDELRRVTEPDMGKPAEARLRASMTALLAHLERGGAGWVWLVGGGAAADPDLRELGDRMRAITVSRVLAGLPPGVAPTPLTPLAVRGWVGFMDAVLQFWVRAAGEERRSRDEVVELLVEGLRGCLRAAGVTGV
jgi:AcrR family transcriptional regulator